MSRRLFAVQLKASLSWSQRPPACTHCGKPATKEALFKESGIMVVEKYCDDCIMDPKKFREILRMHCLASRKISYVPLPRDK